MYDTTWGDRSGHIYLFWQKKSNHHLICELT
jgi:hypothetical protein